MSYRSRLIIAVFCALLMFETLLAAQYGYLPNLIVLAGP
jgi:hypothetical protein